MSLLLVAAAALAAGAAHDSSSVLIRTTTPTVVTSPITGIKEVLVADSVVVEKGKRTLTLYRSGVPVRTFEVALGPQPSGDKVRVGDGRTPEGVYRIDSRNANSKYHMSLHISYPDVAHLRRASALGVSPGGDIMIHGLPPAYAGLGAAHAAFNWTEGCIAVTDAEIEEIWRALPNGAPIQIKP